MARQNNSFRPHDHSTSAAGSNLTPDSVSTDEVSRNRSHRQGSVVYYDPRNSGPYVDGADALADVPPGGTLLLASTVYDVGTEGRLVDNSNRIIAGEGNGEDANGNATGTVIDNSDAAVDAPAIESSTTNRTERARVENLSVLNGAPNASGVLFDNVVRGIAYGVTVKNEGGGQHGIKWASEAFLGRAINCKVNRSASHSYYVEDGSGFDYLFWGCQASSGGAYANAGSAGLQTERQQTWVIGGQYDHANTDCAGLRWDNVTADGDAVVGGGSFATAHEQAPTAIEMVSTGGGGVKNVQHYYPYLLLNNVSTGIYYGDTVGCKAIQPSIISAGGGGDAVEFSADAVAPVYSIPRNGSQAPVTDGGAVAPLLRAEFSARDGDILALPTAAGVPIQLSWATSQSAPASYNGTDWINVHDGTTFTP